jgi:hypothetical protein
MSDTLEAPPDPPDKVPATPPSPRATSSAPARSGTPRVALAPTRTALWTFAGVGALASVVGLAAGPSAQAVVGPFLPLVVAGTLVSAALALRAHPPAPAPHSTDVADATDAGGTTAAGSPRVTEEPVPPGETPEGPPLRLG